MSSGAVFELMWPQPLPVEHAAGMLRAFAADLHRAPVVFEARARAGRVTYLVRGLGAAARRRVLEQVPGLRLRERPDAAHVSVARCGRLMLRQPRRPLADADPVVAVRTMLAALAGLAPTEDVIVQVILGPGRSPHTVPRWVADPGQDLVHQLVHGVQSAEGRTRTELQAQADEHWLSADIRFATTATGTRSEPVIRGLLAASRIVERDGPRFALTGVRPDQITDARAPRRFPLPLTVPVALVLLALPVGKEPLPGQPPAHPKRLIRTDVPKERAFAVVTDSDSAVRVGIPADEARFHTVLLGPTGSGKSTVLVNLAVTDMAAGQSVVVIDPKADTVRALLERIPRHRQVDVAVLDLAAPDPLGFNPLRVGGRDPYVVADTALGILSDLFAPVGPRSLDVLNSALLTLTLTGGTLVELPDLLLDPAVRRRVVGRLQDEALLGFWARYEQYTPAQQLEVIGPTMSRLRRLLLRPGLRHMLAAHEDQDGFPLEDLFTAQRILLVPLNKGIAGQEASALLGSLLVSSLWTHVLAQADKPEAVRRPVTIYVDEVQDYLHRLPGSDLADALAQSRSLNTRWVLAHQYRRQLTGEMLAALDSNALNKIIFRLPPKDAAELAAFAPDLEAADFAALGSHEVYAQITKRGVPQPWLSATTLPLPPGASDPIEILERSRHTYGPRRLAAESDVPAVNRTADPDSGRPIPSSREAEEEFGRTRRRRS